MTSGVEPMRRRARRLTGWVAAALVVVLAACGIFQFTHRDPFGGRVHANEWQAVILSNDRVYFGHLRTKMEDKQRIPLA